MLFVQGPFEAQVASSAQPFSRSSLLGFPFNPTAASSQMAAELEKGGLRCDSCQRQRFMRCRVVVSKVSSSRVPMLFLSNSANGFPLRFACSTAVVVFFVAVYFRL